MMNMHQSTATNGSDQHFLNAYKILNLEILKWDVNVYKCESINSDKQRHEDRSKIKSIVWELRSRFKDRCRGFGFVIDTDEKTVVVPQKWDIPQQNNYNGYFIEHQKSLTVNATSPNHHLIVATILRDSIKNNFKNNISDELGFLWKDYNDFCQMPNFSNIDQDVVYCRKFIVIPELLDNGIWVLKMAVTTRSLDANTLADYYRNGEVQRLAEMIKLKRDNRLTRDNTEIDIRVWWFKNVSEAEVITIENPDEIIKHGELDSSQQEALVNRKVRCTPFKKPPINVQLDQLRLIPESSISLERHSETIIEPDDRIDWYAKLHKFVNGIDAFGSLIHLDKNPINISQFENTYFSPPALLIKTNKTKIGRLEALGVLSRRDLKQRSQQRRNFVHRNGYFQERPINPLIAYPINFGESRAKRLQNDFNWHIKQQGIDYQFDHSFPYNSVRDIEKEIQNHQEYDALLAVLPEGSRSTLSGENTHEEIKKKIQITSQCIHHDNTLPEKWVEKSWTEIKNTDIYKARRIDDKYKHCILNLLVKHHWIPFVPAEPFHYNVHVGIDVGGMHNTKVMICIGNGFGKPSEGLTFLPKEVNVPTRKVEPVPANFLYQGLLDAFEELYDELNTINFQPDFNRILFFRDGEFRGKGNRWNEIDALTQLHEEFRKRKWINENNIWTALEISKRASYWRVFYRNKEVIENPTVGKCIFPYNDKNTAIVCTTGEPYLSQGTASPLLVNIKNIHGLANPYEALRDLIWEADMCFSKIDTGMKLPWVLHVADEGALQLSKAYKITGITV